MLAKNAYRGFLSPCPGVGLKAIKIEVPLFLGLWIRWYVYKDFDGTYSRIWFIEPKKTDYWY